MLENVYNDCTGCHACYNACPQKCILMKEDSYGFLYPHIEHDKCKKCRLCENVCPLIKKNQAKTNVASYACINKDNDIRMISSSGGIFTLLAKKVIENKGVVFGAAFNEDLKVVHLEVHSSKDIFKLRGSKYVQSKIGNTYKKVKEYLEKNFWVYFSGTPCQIGGLKSYLEKDYEKLITQDIICHGVPSPVIWKYYKEYLEGKQKERISRYSVPSFRFKDGSWKRYSVSIKFDNNKEYRKTLDNDLYMKAFLANLSLRKSCYNCHFKGVNRISDITLADFWGIERIEPDFDDDKGTSLVMINSEKGKILFDSIKSEMKYKEVDIYEALKYNSSLTKSVEYNSDRDDFFRTITTDSFEKVILKYTKQPLHSRAIKLITHVLKKFGVKRR